MTTAREWLETIGLAQYGEAFEQNDIDMELLAQVDDQILKDIGVASAGHRLRIRNAIAKLGAASRATPDDGRAGPALATAAGSAERRQVIVMFTDLVGSTAMSTRMDPEDLREVISAYQQCVAETMRRFGGFVAKYMGDGVLVYFGYPQAHEDDAERAVRAGLALVEAVPKLATRAAEAVHVRVGIATGLVVVGDLIGSGEAQERGIVGETPNLAARLQGIAQPDVVVFAESTRRLVGDLFELRDLGLNELKGLASPVHAFAAVRPRTIESRFDALRAATTPLVGRDAETETLMQCFSRARRREGQVALISGEPGIGKSRMVSSLARQLASEPHLALRCQCSPSHRDSALYPIVAQIERAAEFKPDDPSERRLERLEGLLATTTPQDTTAAHLLADLLAIPTGDRYPALNLTAAQQRRQTLAVLTDYVAGFARDKPLLFVFEDAHWADASSLELLDLAIDRLRGLPVLALITFRPEFAPAWVGEPHVTMLRLARLDPAEVRAMAERVAGGRALPAQVLDQIVRKTDGVPLFVEELTKTIVESGLMVETDGGFRLDGPLPPLAIPATLQDSLVARLDRLAPVKVIAQTGAAIGREFSYKLLEAVIALDEPTLRAGLRQLEDAELVFSERAPPDADYVFKHALVRDAAYETLLRSSRQQLHARIANVLEAQFQDIASNTPEVVAQHYTAAGLAAQAIPCWLSAGRTALGRSAAQEAINHLTNGLALLPHMADAKLRGELELELQAARGLALAAAKGFAVSEVEEAYGRARALCDATGNTSQRVPVLYGLFMFHWCRGHLLAARAIAEEMLGIAGDTNDAELRLVAHSALGNINFHIGDNETAGVHLFAAHAQYDERRHAPLILKYGQDFGVMTMYYVGDMELIAGRAGTGLRSTMAAMKLARELKHPLSLCTALGFHTVNMLYRHDPESALRSAEECMTLAGEHGFPHWHAMAKSYGGWALAQLGNVDKGLQQIRSGIAAWRAVGCDVALGAYLATLSETELLAGDAETALATGNEALAWIERNAERQFECLVRYARGDALCALGHVETGEEEYNIALMVARRQQAKFWELRAAVRLSKLWCDRGHLDAARNLLAPLHAQFVEGRGLADVKEAEMLLRAMN